jgi:hypothetical protein
VSNAPILISQSLYAKAVVLFCFVDLVRCMDAIVFALSIYNLPVSQQAMDEPSGRNRVRVFLHNKDTLAKSWSFCGGLFLTLLASISGERET